MFFRNPLDISCLILRLTVGGLMVLHGIHKLINGTDGIARGLENAGLPGFLVYGVPVGEVIAPILLIVGVFTRPAALLVAFTMLMSIFLVFRDRVFTLNEVGGWVIELNMFFLMVSLVLFILGSGKYALRRSVGLLS